jgi:hypothetical protein
VRIRHLFTEYDPRFPLSRHPAYRRCGPGNGLDAELHHTVQDTVIGVHSSGTATCAARQVESAAGEKVITVTRRTPGGSGPCYGASAPHFSNELVILASCGRVKSRGGLSRANAIAGTTIPGTRRGAEARPSQRAVENRGEDPLVLSGAIRNLSGRGAAAASQT